MQSSKVNGKIWANIYLFISGLYTLYGIYSLIKFNDHSDIETVLMGFAAVFASLKMRSERDQPTIQFVLGLCVSLLGFSQAILRHNPFFAIFGLVVLIAVLIQFMRKIAPSKI